MPTKPYSETSTYVVSEQLELAECEVVKDCYEVVIYTKELMRTYTPIHLRPHPPFNNKLYWVVPVCSGCSSSWGTQEVFAAPIEEWP